MDVAAERGGRAQDPREPPARRTQEAQIEAGEGDGQGQEGA